MKILYLDLNLLYHNPTRNNLPMLLKKIADVKFYGPGYSSEEELKKGIQYFYDKNGPFDFIATTEHILFELKEFSIKHKNIYKASHYRQYPFEHGRFTPDIREFFIKSENKKVVFLLESDFYNFHKIKTDLLESIEAYIFGFNKQIISPIEELEYIQKEHFAVGVNDNWQNFVNDNLVIPFTHFVSLSEFYYETIDNRKNYMLAPGANYYHRKNVIQEVLINKKLNLGKQKVYNKIYSLLSKLKFKPYSHHILMRLYNILFRDQIEQTKYTYTCGSSLNWPLRKFFEIPAFGALLIANPFKNYEEFGFLDGKNFIAANGENIIEKLDYLDENFEEAIEIAKAGQEMVFKLHSIDARSEQLKTVLNKIMTSELKDCYWNKGEFIVK